MSWNSAEKKAREILEQNGFNQTIPFDPVRLANMNGISVKNAVFKTNDIAGIISRDQGITTIYVNSKDPNTRKRFTVAHELGHYFLHLNSQDDALVVEYRTISSFGDDKEKEANSFAAALLMDEVLVKSLWNDLKSVQTIAEIFQVSYEAMGYRLNNLGLI